jgi:hypothetical protein
MHLLVRKRPVEKRKGVHRNPNGPLLRGEARREALPQLGLRASLGSMTQASSLRRWRVVYGGKEKTGAKDFRLPLDEMFLVSGVLWSYPEDIY